MKYDGYDRDARTNDIEPAELTEVERLPRSFRTLQEVADAIVERRRTARATRQMTKRGPPPPSPSASAGPTKR
jgi:hypothetical protein